MKIKKAYEFWKNVEKIKNLAKPYVGVSNSINNNYLILAEIWHSIQKAHLMGLDDETILKLFKNPVSQAVLNLIDSLRDYQYSLENDDKFDELDRVIKLIGDILVDEI